MTYLLTAILTIAERLGHRISQELFSVDRAFSQSWLWQWHIDLVLAKVDQRVILETSKTCNTDHRFSTLHRKYIGRRNYSYALYLIYHCIFPKSPTIKIVDFTIIHSRKACSPIWLQWSSPSVSTFFPISEFSSFVIRF